MDMEFINSRRPRIESGFRYFCHFYENTDLSFRDAFIYGVYLCPECVTLFDEEQGSDVEKAMRSYSQYVPPEVLDVLGHRITDFRRLFTSSQDPFGSAEAFYQMFHGRPLDDFWQVIDDGVPIEDVLA